MANRIVISLTLGTLVLGLASCSGTETPEQCVERLTKAFPDPNFFDSGPWRSTLTYRLGDDFKIPELQPGAVSSGLRDGPTFTTAVGPGKAALNNFTRQDVPNKGAYLAWNDETYFRTRGPVGSPRDAIAAGCADGLKGSQLISVDFAPEREERPASGQTS